MAIEYTKEELKEFDRVTLQASSHNQLERINGRMALRRFIDEHGKEKCDEMWKVLV